MDEQLIWHDLPIFDELMSHRDGLINDFMSGFTDLKEAILTQSENSISPTNYNDDQIDMALEGMLVVRDPNTLKWNTDLSAWQSLNLKNVVKFSGEVKVHDEIAPDRVSKFPTGKAIMDRFGDELFGLVYSSIGPYTILQRHDGPENIDGEYIRIHIPLVIPPGDTFIEVKGQEITWDNIFGFNNQYLHSAHNYTNEWRMIMIVDLARTACGLPPGRYFNESAEVRKQHFVRGM